MTVGKRSFLDKKGSVKKTNDIAKVQSHLCNYFSPLVLKAHSEISQGFGISLKYLSDVMTLVILFTPLQPFIVMVLAALHPFNIMLLYSITPH